MACIKGPLGMLEGPCHSVHVSGNYVWRGRVGGDPLQRPEGVTMGCVQKHQQLHLEDEATGEGAESV